MKKVGTSLFLLLFVLGLVKCSEFFVEDISGKKVELISPSENLVTDKVSHDFWWNQVEGAKNYNLQIVQSNFSNPKQFVLDTSISGTRFSKTLFPGEFQWRVKAFNSEYETTYEVRSMTIDSTADLTNERIVLTAPKADLATSYKSLTFSWEPLYNADEYRFIIKENDWQGAFLVDTVITTDSQIELTLDEGPYAWGVRGQNNESQTNTPYNTRILEIDYTAPQTPVLLNPSNNDTVNTTLITFQWKRSERSGTSIKDSLVVSNDTTFSELVFNTCTEDTIYTWNPSVELIKKYYWKVRSNDRAGNKSQYSEINKFFIESEKTKE